MQSPPVTLWLWAFAWTLALELPCYALALRRYTAGGWPLLALAVGVNAVTHPALWYLMPRFSPYWAWVLVAEALVVAVEAALVALWLHRRRVARPLVRGLVASVVANAVSTAVGFWVVG